MTHKNFNIEFAVSFFI